MECAIENMHRLGAGHSFLIVMQNAFPYQCAQRYQELS
jgi:adenosine/AMP kinase